MIRSRPSRPCSPPSLPSCPAPLPRPRRHPARTLPLLLAFLLAFFFFPQAAHAIKFDLPAAKYPSEKCIWHYVNADTLVVVTAHVNLGHKQRVDLEIVDGGHHGNVYLSKKDVKGESRFAITTHAHADLGVCFKNFLADDAPAHLTSSYSTIIDLDIDIGAEAVDYNAIANQEHLSTLEVDMRKLEQMCKEVVNEMNYLKKREERMRDTNESTNVRVKGFAFLTLGIIISLGVWQVLHLRTYFRRKFLID